jgi:putative membrane protein
MMLNLSTPALGLVVKFEELAPVLVTTAIFTAFGLLVFGLAYFIILKASPFSIRKEIEEDQNVALAVVIGAVIIGISLIIAAAIQG